MTHKPQVREHLRNGALYGPASGPSPGGEWKRRLFRQRSMRNQLEAALRERHRSFKWLLYVGIPVTCVVLVSALYLGFLPLIPRIENMVPLADFHVPPIGLKEVLVFIAIVNGLTLLIKRRAFSF